MQFHLIVARLPLLHEIIARHVTQDATKGLLLFGLAIFAQTFAHRPVTSRRLVGRLYAPRS